MTTSENDAKKMIRTFVDDKALVKFRNFNISHDKIKNEILKKRKKFINMEIPQKDLEEIFAQSTIILEKQNKKFTLLLVEIDNVNNELSTKNKIEYLKIIKTNILEIINLLLDQKKLISQAQKEFTSWRFGEYNAFYNMLSSSLKKEKTLYTAFEKNFYMLLNEIRLKAPNIKVKKHITLIAHLMLLKTIALWGTVHEKAHDLVHYVLIGIDDAIDTTKLLTSSKKSVLSTLESVY